MILNCLPTTLRYTNILVKTFLKRFSSSVIFKSTVNEIEYNDLYISINMMLVIASTIKKSLITHFVEYKYTTLWSYDL